MKFGDKQRAFIRAPFSHCLDVAEGTPRSGKTTAATFRFAAHTVASIDSNHLVVAYNQEQAYRLIIEGDGYGLLHIFAGSCSLKHDDNGDHLAIDTPSGVKRVYYKGGGKVDSNKAITGLSFGSVYFCEINLLHMNMIQECFRRTFAAQDRWHIADLNPPAPMHPVISQVFDVQDTNWTHWTVHDNPIITPKRRAEIEAVCKKSPYLWRRDWLGERVVPEGVIYSMFDVQRHVLSRLPDGIPIEMFFAGDGGLTDATSVGCYIVMQVDRRAQLYRVANWYYGDGDKAMSTQAREIARNFRPYCREKYKRIESCWKIDPACKALRKELELCGIMADSADNNAHDVKGARKGIEVGIEYVQSCIADGRLYIVDDERFGAYYFLQEIGMYCVDSHGKPVDAYNHCMDELRYAVNYFYKRYVL